MSDAVVSGRMRSLQQAHHADVEVPDFPRIEKVVRALRGFQGTRMLDLGYSRGSFADSFAAKGWRCIGLDLNLHPPSSVRIALCDLNSRFPLTDRSFDLITAGEVIEHILDQELFLKECSRVLRPGGVLALTTPNLAFLLNRFIMFFGGLPLFVTAPYHYHFHTMRTLRQLVEGQGFRVERALSSHLLYSRRKHWTGTLFERLGDLFPTLGAHLILIARKS